MCLAGLELNFSSRLNNSSSVLRFRPRFVLKSTFNFMLHWGKPALNCFFPRPWSKTGFNSVRKAISLWSREWLHANLPFYFHSAAEMMQNILWITHLRIKWYNEKVRALISKRSDDKLALLKSIREWSPNQFLTVTYLPHRLSRGFAIYVLLVIS